jgi:hypothetical protein
MLNTDRGSDNFMIKCCDIDREKAPIVTPAVNTSRVDTPQMSEIRKPNPATSGVVVPPTATPSISALWSKTPGTSTPSRRRSHTHIAAPTNIHAVGGHSLTDCCTFLSASSVGLSAQGPGTTPCHCRNRRLHGSSGSRSLRIRIPSKDVQCMPLLRQKAPLWFLTVARSEKTSRYQGAGVEHHSIVETRGELLFVYVTFRSQAYGSSR